MLKMELHGVNLDITTNQPVVILKDAGARRYLPIWIGQFEATSILMEVQGVKAARPLTHDLLRDILNRLRVKVNQIVINDLKDGTFYAKIYFKSDSEVLEIDARPSDAIALAVRTKSPIFAEDSVVEKAAVVSEEGEEAEIEQFRNFLSQIKPEDFKI